MVNGMIRFLFRTICLGTPNRQRITSYPFYTIRRITMLAVPVRSRRSLILPGPPAITATSVSAPLASYGLPRFAGWE